MRFSIKQGDIAQQSADVLVNAANTGLRMGSGVAGALRRRGGEPLNQAAIDQGPIDLGGVAVTDAFDLDATYVIHAAAMPPGGQATAESIRLATRNALRAADERGCHSIVLPAIGCGVAGFSLEDGARIIVEELAAFESQSLESATFIAYGDTDYETITKLAREHAPEAFDG